MHELRSGCLTSGPAQVAQFNTFLRSLADTARGQGGMKAAFFRRLMQVGAGWLAGWLGRDNGRKQ